MADKVERTVSKYAWLCINARMRNPSLIGMCVRRRSLEEPGKLSRALTFRSASPAGAARQVLAGYESDWNRVPATSAQACRSAPEAPTAVAAGRASTAWAWGDGGPHAGRGLAVSLAEQLVRLRGKVLGAAEMLRSGHRCSLHLAVWYCSDTAQAHRRTSVRGQG
jgi:hypothetical protein